MSLADIAAQVEAAGVERVYEENRVPASPTYPYVVLAGSFGAPSAATVDGHKHTPRWVTARIFAKASVALDDTAATVDAALNGRALAIPGSPVAEFLQANQTSRDADDGGVLGMVLTYRY